MNFNRHLNLEGEHAFLSASKYHWVNYGPERIDEAYAKYLAVQKGTELHAFACRCIELGQKLPKSKKALNMYVNDAIGYRMTPEQVLYYSDNSFGTADSISFHVKDKLLRIHDFKSGVTPASMKQLEVYESLFCLEYNQRPEDIASELRIYQGDEILVHIPDPEVIRDIMDKIIMFDKRIEKLKSEES
jgi:hypothetical protein